MSFLSYILLYLAAKLLNQCVFRWLKTENGQNFADAVGVEEAPMGVDDAVVKIVEQVCLSTAHASFLSSDGRGRRSDVKSRSITRRGRLPPALSSAGMERWCLGSKLGGE